MGNSCKTAQDSNIPSTFICMLTLISEKSDRSKSGSSIMGETTDDNNTNILNPATKICKEDFKFIKVIGRGTFGKVYMVKKKESEKVYAMKVLKKEQVSSRNLKIKTKCKHRSVSDHL
jgi:hypothetical protein